MSSDTPATPRTRTGPSLVEPAREFLRHGSPWILIVGTTATWIWRALAGELDRMDLVVVAAYLAAFPLLEWVIHTTLLHWRPKELGSLTLDPLVARKHREHHADPTVLEHVFIPLPALVGSAVALVALGAVLPSPRGVTFVATVFSLGLVYEWTHYLVHTEYRPRTRLYRAIWRHHRLHHYKNEHYWFTVTTTGTADRLLGTQPDPGDVQTSPTARDLLGTGGP
jgi:sterol desaturase/sphingolipid hydroxylase (fatty acid hydroxylase superfamily)